MLSSAEHKTTRLGDSQSVIGDAKKLASRTIWLPKLLYDALPYFYLTAGFAAFFATLYVSEWFWVLPHYLLFSAACIHLGIYIYQKRHPRDEKT